jgi:hypothetical protein
MTGFLFIGFDKLAVFITALSKNLPGVRALLGLLNASIQELSSDCGARYTRYHFDYGFFD